MSKVIIKSIPCKLSRELYGSKQQMIDLIINHLSEYTICDKEIELSQIGEAAAEEIFDLTNNPSRQEERELKYGRGKSVSVGDVIEVDGINYACMSFGWEQI